MMRAVVFVAFLFLPALSSATDYFVKRNGCFYRVAAPAYHAPTYHAPAAPTQSAGQAITALAGKKAEWAFITESIHELFGTPLDGSSSYSSSYAIQRGNTAYGAPQQSGYSLQSFATVTPQPLDVEALMERATRLASQAQDNGAAATAQAQGLLGQAQAGQQAIAQTFAQAARELSVLEALKPINPQEVQAQTEFRATASSSGNGQATATAGPQAEADAPLQASAQVVSGWRPKFAAIVATKCATCHDQESPAGGLNMVGDVSAISGDQAMAMLKAVTNKDPSKRMPKDGEPLSDSEIALFARALAEAK